MLTNLRHIVLNACNRSNLQARSLFGLLSSQHHLPHPSFSLSFNLHSLSLSLSRHSSRLMSTEKKHIEVGVEAPTGDNIPDTIFGKMGRGEINVPFVYSDDKCFVLDDLNPQAPIHMLVIPRKPISQLSKASDEDRDLLGHLLLVVRDVAKQRQLDEGYRVVINDGKDGCQSVYHLHIHVLGKRTLSWPPG